MLRKRLRSHKVAVGVVVIAKFYGAQFNSVNGRPGAARIDLLTQILREPRHNEFKKRKVAAL